MTTNDHSSDTPPDHFQLFAYHVANLNGRSIDRPRTLAKGVTVE